MDNNKEILFKNSQAREVIKLFRQLCYEKNEVQEKVLKEFFKDTKNATEMGFYSSNKVDMSSGESVCLSVSFFNDEWVRKWDEDELDSLDDNDHIITYFFPNVEIELGEYIPSMGEEVPDYLNFEDISGRGRLLLEFLHRYFKLFPEDVFRRSHFYTKDDIDKLYAKVPWNETWMYEDPKTF